MESEVCSRLPVSGAGNVMPSPVTCEENDATEKGKLNFEFGCAAYVIKLMCRVIFTGCLVLLIA